MRVLALILFCYFAEAAFRRGPHRGTELVTTRRVTMERRSTVNRDLAALAEKAERFIQRDGEVDVKSRELEEDELLICQGPDACYSPKDLMQKYMDDDFPTVANNYTVNEFAHLRQILEELDDILITYRGERKGKPGTPAVNRAVLGKALGSGSFKEVYHGTYKSKPVAIAVVLDRDSHGKTELEDLYARLALKELENWQKISDQVITGQRRCQRFVVPLIGTYVDEAKRSQKLKHRHDGKTKVIMGIFIVMALADGHSLEEWKDNPKLLSSDAERLGAAIQLTSATFCVHHAGIVNRDIKPENFLKLKDKTVWMADFGFTSRLDDREHLAINCGTEGYKPPEEVATSSLWRFDIFSLGVTFDELGLRRVLSPATMESMIAKDYKLRPSTEAILRELALKAVQPFISALGSDYKLLDNVYLAMARLQLAQQKHIPQPHGKRISTFGKTGESRLVAKAREELSAAKTAAMAVTDRDAIRLYRAIRSIRQGILFIRGRPDKVLTHLMSGKSLDK